MFNEGGGAYEMLIASNAAKILVDWMELRSNRMSVICLECVDMAYLLDVTVAAADGLEVVTAELAAEMEFG